MRRIDLSFLLLATLSLIVGACLGIWMGIVHDFQFAPVHAHLNLLGWVSLAIFGLTYRAYPELNETWVATVHFWTAVLAVVLFPIGIGLSVAGVTPGVAIAGSLVFLTSVVLFLANLLRVALRDRDAVRTLAPAE